MKKKERENNEQSLEDRDNKVQFGLRNNLTVMIKRIIIKHFDKNIF